MTSSGITILLMLFVLVLIGFIVAISLLFGHAKTVKRERDNMTTESDALRTILLSKEVGYRMEEDVVKGGHGKGNSAICTIYREDEMEATSTAWTDKVLTESVVKRLKREARLDALKKVVDI